MKSNILFKLINSLVFVAFFSSCSGGNTDAGTDSNSKNDEPRKKVLIETSYGNIIIELYNETPLHRDNFIKLVSEEVYNGTLFHRVINQFMIQGGDPDSKEAQPGQQLGMGGPGYTIDAEFVADFFHVKGALAAARQGDNVNPMKKSSGSQFYIVQGRPFAHQELDILEQRTGKPLSNEKRRMYSTVGGTPHLDGEYTVFGIVVEGLEVVDSIASVKTDQMNRPLEDVSVKMKVLD
ncbi:MAG: peptidylprolyl isomerase [Bacteroidetes bacterium]|nr:peptidylprolyl isomerase [Bacteroidota bacterium]